jgi:hypothetical protein
MERAAVLVVGSAAAALACGGAAGGPAGAPTHAPPDAPVFEIAVAASESPAPADAGAKLDLYVEDCLNRFSPRTYQSWERYLQWVDPATGPTGNEMHKYGLYSLNFPAHQCSKAARDAAARPPSMPELEAAADQYVIALEKVALAIEEANAYYEHEDWKDDGMARGKRMHGPLMAAWEEFARADEALSAQVATKEVESAMRLSERLRASGSDWRLVLVIDAYLAARPMAQTAATARVDGSGRLVGLDVAAYGAQVEAFEKAADALGKVARETGWTDSVVSEADDLLEAAKRLHRIARDGEAFDDWDRRQIGTSSGWMVEGSPDQVLNAYVDFVGAYNWVVDSPKAQSPAWRRSWRAPGR